MLHLTAPQKLHHKSQGSTHHIVRIMHKKEQNTNKARTLAVMLSMMSKSPKRRLGRRIIVYVLFVSLTLKFDTNIITKSDRPPSSERGREIERVSNTGAFWNPTLLPPGMPKLWLVSNGVRYEIPTDADWITKYYSYSPNSWKQHKVEYIRGYTDEVEAYSKQINCTGTLDVLNWLSTNENSNGRTSKGCLMVAYGGLIHTLREKEFVDTNTGAFLDDDIDGKSNITSVLYFDPDQ